MAYGAVGGGVSLRMGAVATLRWVATLWVPRRRRGSSRYSWVSFLPVAPATISPNFEGAPIVLERPFDAVCRLRGPAVG